MVRMVQSVTVDRAQTVDLRKVSTFEAARFTCWVDVESEVRDEV